MSARLSSSGGGTAISLSNLPGRLRAGSSAPGLLSSERKQRNPHREGEFEATLVSLLQHHERTKNERKKARISSPKSTLLRYPYAKKAASSGVTQTIHSFLPGAGKKTHVRSGIKELHICGICPQNFEVSLRTGSLDDEGYYPRRGACYVPSDFLMIRKHIPVCNGQVAWPSNFFGYGRPNL